MTCWVCGAKAERTCSQCGAQVCLTDTRYYVDENNAAITKSALPECCMCFPDKFPRPYEWVRALERGEWEL